MGLAPSSQASVLLRWPCETRNQQIETLFDSSSRQAACSQYIFPFWTQKYYHSQLHNRVYVFVFQFVSGALDEKQAIKTFPESSTHLKSE